MDNGKLTGTWYISSNHCRLPGQNVVIVRETNEYTCADGSKHYVPNLKYYDDPVRPFWITKPEFRNHDYKKEFEDVDKCDMYTCHDSDLEYRLSMALKVGWKRLPLVKLFNNPYVYGADIETECIVRQEYSRHAPKYYPPYTKGGLDIENEVIGEKRINLITFIHDHTIYTAGLKEFCKVYEDESHIHWHWATKSEIQSEIMHWVGDLITKYNFKLVFEICDTEVLLIKWIFDRIHEAKTDYIGIWNINYDIPHILERLRANNVRPEMIMCHPDVPRDYQYVKYIEDRSDCDHFTDKWHWVSIPGYSQFIDAMCLYARLRKVYGRESSYALDKIADKELGLRKLHFDGSDNVNHRVEQEFHFLRYWAYNVNDVLIMQLMEFQNDDYGSMISLCDVSLLSQFSRMTVGLKHDAFIEGLAHGKVPASVGSGYKPLKVEDELPRVGGTVLPPNKAENVFIKAIPELPDQGTLVSVMTNDLDVSSFYPSTTEEFNISKESALATITKINGHPVSAVEHFTSNIVQPNIGAVDIATTYYGLPTYKQMLHEFEDFLEDYTKDFSDNE